MRWWLMSVPLALLLSGCTEAEDLFWGDDGFFDQVIAPTVEQSFSSSSSSSNTSGSSTSKPKASSGTTPHPYDYGKSTSEPKPSSGTTPHPYDYGKSAGEPKASSGTTPHPYDYGKSTSEPKPSSGTTPHPYDYGKSTSEPKPSSSSSSGPTYKIEPVKTTPSLPDFGTESPGLEPRHYESETHSSSRSGSADVPSAGTVSAPDPDAVYHPAGSASDSTAASRGSVSRPSRVRRPSDSGTAGSRSGAGTSASRPESSAADDQ